MTLGQSIILAITLCLAVCLPSCIHYILITRELKKIEKEYNRKYKRD